MNDNMLKIKNIAELKTIVGYEFEPTDWVTIDQKMINLFAEATGVPAYLADEPALCVAKGTGIALENLQSYKRSVLAK